MNLVTHRYDTIEQFRVYYTLTQYFHALFVNLECALLYLYLFIVTSANDESLFGHSVFTTVGLRYVSVELTCDFSNRMECYESVQHLEAR